MEERRRRRLLAAMGIPVWLPRGAAGAPAGAEAADDGEGTAGPQPVLPRRAGATAGPALAAPGAGPDPSLAALDWERLRDRVAACQACPELVRNRGRTVFGVGNREARLMVIGEAPGVDEDRQGEPFVGRAGRLLDRMLQAIGFARERVYIANVLKCRPPGNRDPQPAEAERCAGFLARQVELVAPELILAVGRVSAQSLLRTDATVGRLRGRVHYFGPGRIPLVVTYHPAYLLRSPEQKAKAWSDLRLALRTLA
jgi:DNA polymerase